ncbi:hypothetical protein GCM10008959_23820 [Deinococcus seoulensis]|uniref:GIY-YIG nuclease family protein n=1 Tax=Deinococcus seoulensis TaxID=1837379 RepID=A0ABQ2RRX2_9DEIO|nr:hypothetical protein [Deinococcus seoulensis]GGR61147.1 hypothetical protein GCM10008959_23820 [Deinococcus seoulensis]
MSDDHDRKRALLLEWLTTHDAHRVALHDGGKVESVRILMRLRAALPNPEESVYILVRRDAPTMPIYVGRAAQPVSRWKGHLRSLLESTSRADAWRAHFQHDLDLYVVPVTAMQGPPIPGFPVTVGAVEAQLISLAQDTSPALLNREGVRR